MTEAEIQKHCVTVLLQLLPAKAADTLRHFSFNARNAVAARNAKLMGAQAGWPDLQFIHCGRTYTIEVKRPGKKPTKPQRETRDAIFAAGAEWALVTDHDQIAPLLKAWGIQKEWTAEADSVASWQENNRVMRERQP